MKTTRKGCSLVPLALAISLALTVPITVHAQPRVKATSLSIASQPLGSALNELSAATGTAIGFSPALVAAKTARAVTGTLTVRQAVEQMLSGSGLIAVQEGAGIVIQQAANDEVAVLDLLTVTAQGGFDNTSSVTEGTGSYTQSGPSGAATGLALSLRETPQSVTVMTSQRMEDFKLETLAEVMEQAPGITVERQGSHVGFSARGAAVNVQTEGNQQLTHGYSYFGSSHYTLDSMVDVDRIEILKGSNGLMVGKGSTGATINMIRKRPTREFQASVGASAGSWSNYSADVDVGGPLNEGGTLRGRISAAVNDGDSFRDYESSKNQAVYGTLEVDLTPETVLSTGLTYRKREVRGLAMWENILAYRSSDPAQFLGWKPRSYNPGASWAGYEQESINFFSRLEHQFTNGWSGKVQLAHESTEMPELLLARADGDFDTATRYLDTENRNSSIIADLKGPLQLFGRTHDVLFGTGALNATADFDSNKFGYSHHYQKQRYAYAASRLSLAEPLKVIVGARITSYKAQDKTIYSWMNSSYDESGVVTPYAGLVFDVHPNISLYGSYASIFQPQTNQDEQGRILAPREGLSYEIGAKGEFFDKRLNASISHFWIQTDNEPEAIGGITPSGGTAYRAVMGASRRGYELELSGELARNWQVQGGYTMNSSNLNSAGSNPKHQFKLGSTYRFGAGHFQDLTIGAATRWQSTTSTAVSTIFVDSKLQQQNYWLLDLMARYQLSDYLSISANINNVFDKKYFAYVVNGTGGLGYTWGATRNVNVSMRYEF